MTQHFASVCHMHAVPAVCGTFVHLLCCVARLWRAYPFLVSFMASEVAHCQLDMMVQIHFKLVFLAFNSLKGIKCSLCRVWHEIPTTCTKLHHGWQNYCIFWCAQAEQGIAVSVTLKHSNHLASATAPLQAMRQRSNCAQLDFCDCSCIIPCICLCNCIFASHDESFYKSIL